MVLKTHGTMGLYYPFIHFKDERWLKLSALYWDKMARIVPEDYPRRSEKNLLKGDSDVAERLIGECDFIVNVPPEAVTEEVGDLFMRFLDGHAAELREKYAVSLSASWKVDEITKLYANLRNKHLAYVLMSKVATPLRLRLIAEGLAEEHNEAGLWAGMHPLLASVYMSAVAYHLAKVNDSRPATDEVLDHVAAAEWTVPRLAAALLGDRRLMKKKSAVGSIDEVDPERRASLALIAIESVVPADPSKLTVEKIAKIRKACRPELFRFQEFVDRTAKELVAFDARTDPAMVRAHLESDYAKYIKPHTDALKAALHGEGVDTVVSAASASVEAAPATMPNNQVDMVFAAAAMALKVIPVFMAKRRKAKATYEAGPTAFLYKLEKELAPKDLLGWIGTSAERFTIGV